MGTRDEMAAVIDKTLAMGLTELTARRIADALVAAGYGKVDGDGDKVRAAVLAVLDDSGGPDSWSHTFQGRQSVFADDVRAALTEPSA